MQLILDGIDLGDDLGLGGEQLEWQDEWEWNLVEQDQQRSLTGALIIQEGVKLYGRPITLASNGGAWFTLARVQQLRNLAEQRGRVMQLTLANGDQHFVTWNFAAGPAVQARMLHRRVNPDLDSLHELTLRLITVAPPAPEPEP